ncbi:branched-chain amino acid ABC transporter substrate-binding protein [Desulfovibrio sp. OttesenSCG-928-F20]|nr:branched-chain amino acid ABC transporter substrate-binding protein [Desulfovibrio sp. OttesenSCG-928-F20]
MRATKLIALFAAAFVLSAPLSGLAADTIKLGIAGAHTGDLAGYGMPALNAAKLVVDKINAAGGINGKMVEILQQDDQCKPELSTNAATKLIAEGAEIVMGHTCSGANKAALPMYEDKKIVSISPSSTNPELTQGGQFPHFFRTIASDDAQARLAADFAVQALEAKKIAILHDKGDYGKTYSEFVKQFIEKDGKAQVVFFEGITPGAVDYSSAVQKIGRSGADTLIFGGYYPEASKLITSIRARKMTINFVSEDGVKTDAFLKLAGKDGEGVYASSSYDYSQNAINKEAIEAHKKTFGADPGQFFETAYSATLALLKAVEKAGTTEAAAVIEALRTHDVETPVGKIRFDERGDCIGAGFAMYKVVDGKYVDQQFEAK